jgi:hypothetical protein
MARLARKPRARAALTSVGATAGVPDVAAVVVAVEDSNTVALTTTLNTDRRRRIITIS